MEEFEGEYGEFGDDGDSICKNSSDEIERIARFHPQLLHPNSAGDDEDMDLDDRIGWCNTLKLAFTLAVEKRESLTRPEVPFHEGVISCAIAVALNGPSVEHIIPDVVLVCYSVVSPNYTVVQQKQILDDVLATVDMSLLPQRTKAIVKVVVQHIFAALVKFHIGCNKGLVKLANFYGTLATDAAAKIDNEDAAQAKKSAKNKKRKAKKRQAKAVALLAALDGSESEDEPNSTKLANAGGVLLHQSPLDLHSNIPYGTGSVEKDVVAEVASLPSVPPAAAGEAPAQVGAPALDQLHSAGPSTPLEKALSTLSLEDTSNRALREKIQSTVQSPPAGSAAPPDGYARTTAPASQAADQGAGDLGQQPQHDPVPDQG